MNNDGFRFLDYIPEELIKAKNATELKIELINGSIIQLIGTDNYDAIRGTNPITCVFSEYAYQNPQAWEVVKPILRVNGGIAIFNTTPQGKNHAYDLWLMAERNEDWFTQKLTVDDTRVVSMDDIVKEQKEGMSLDMIQQEYYCSFEAAIRGAYYSEELKRLGSRVCKGIYNKDLPVYTAWDLGLSDDTAIVFYQLFGKEIRIIDYYANNGMTLPEYITVLKSKPYTYATHFLPWDARIRALSSGKSTYDVAVEHGLTVKICPNISIQDGIQQVRMIFDRCWFEEENTKDLLNSLSQYHREYDEVRKTFRITPFHDWTSHGSDAFRYVALSIKELVPVDDYDSGAQKYIKGNENKYIPSDWKPAKEYRESALDYINAE